MESMILERWPFEVVHYICHTSGTVVVSHDELENTALDFFDLLGMFLRVRGSRVAEANSTVGQTKVL